MKMRGTELPSSASGSNTRRGRPRKNSPSQRINWRGAPLQSSTSANSTLGEVDLENEDIIFAKDSSFFPQTSRDESSKTVLQKVVIPSKTGKMRRLSDKVIPPSQSPLSISSQLSSIHDHISENSTPGTSIVVTPAESLTKLESSSRPSKGSARSTFPNRKRRVEIQSKQKRTSIGEDALLLQMSQEDDSQDDEPMAVISKRRRITFVEDSDDEISLLDMLSEEDSEPNTKPSKLSVSGRRSSLPSRAARDSARRSISNKVTQEATYTDSNTSDLSEYVSGFDSEEVADSDAMDNDVLLDNSALSTTLATAADSNISVNQAVVARSGRRQRAPRRPSMPTRSRAWRDRSAARADYERRKLEAAHPEITTMWEDLKAISPISPIEAKQPDSITRKLKSFQLQGLDWMIRQEKSKWKGGLLGDEMGMGKTIQAVSLIMSDYPAKDPTLVVVPPVALIQWQSEIKEYTNGKLNVLIYHNSNPKVKTMKMKELMNHDVIMISYSGLESIYRKESKGWKREDGIVKENSKIHAIKYHRLILDEAHNIKTRTTGVAKACFALNSDYKWCLSGTPVQNRIGEFFSLLRFLRIQPFACYFCKSCKCAQLHWSQDSEKKCKDCNHSGFQHVSVFNQELLNPITQGEDPELRKKGLQKLRLVTDRIMLRRLKRDYTASMELPPKEVIIHNEFFGEIERDFSSSIMSNTTRQFDTYVSRGVMLNNYANIFGLIMQMRQVANHPDLILKKHGDGGQNVLVCSICDETAEEPIRSRCHHEFCRKCAKDYVRSFDDAIPDCPRCHIPLAIDFDQPDIEQDEDHVKKNSIINRIKMENWTSSTKIEMLIYDLFKLRSQKHTYKSIVFSQFTSMLQLVEWRLRRAGFRTVMLDGSMSPVQRQRSIEHFMENTDVEVFLVSLKAGGVALNLTEASRVFIVDPWWNPAAEWQSADRCHRIGQRRPCVITRLCIEDSVESRMVMLQEKKANMINGTINNDEVAMEKLTPEDMQFLFRGS